MSKAMERAKELRSGSGGNYNCAQSVLIPEWEEMGRQPELPRPAAQESGSGQDE